VTSQRGMTLIEVVVAMFVLTLALVAMYGMTNFIMREWVIAQSQTDVQQNLRVLLDRLARDTRRSSDARVYVAPNASCPAAASGTQCLVLDSTAFIASDVGTNLNPPQEICLEETDGLVVSGTLLFLSPYKYETATISCLGSGCSGSLVCPSGSTKVGFSSPLTFPRQQGEVVTPLPARYELTSAGEVLRNNTPIAAGVTALTITRSETTLATAANLGTATISVVSAASFVVNDIIGIGQLSPSSTCATPLETVKEYKEIRTITAISGTTITLNAPLAACHTLGRPVTAQVFLVAVTGSHSTGSGVAQTGELSMRIRLRD
jgi:prepilin-type N-terminal cleavage/methylation domain-containing protein